MYHAAAAVSEQSPRTTAQMEAAADRADVIARWTPDENSGSMKAAALVRNSWSPKLETFYIPPASPTIRNESPAYCGAE